MRVGVLKFWHESNTFTSVDTELARFTELGTYSGVKLGDECRPEPGDRNSELTGMLDTFEAAPESVQVVPLMSAGSMPSGPWTAEVVAQMEALLMAQLRKALAVGPLDGVCAALHGAMASRHDRDLDGWILELIRAEVGPNVPITVALDCHAVVTARMAQHARCLVSYKTHPHLDLPETGARAASLLLQALQNPDGGPTQCLIRVPMLFADCGTEVGELKQIFADFAAAEEAPGVLSCCLNMAFPMLDAEDQGWTVVVITDDDIALAESLCTTLAQRVWDARTALWGELELGVPMQEAMRQAAAVETGRAGPVVITDAADNVGGGTPGDTPGVLRELLTHRELFAPTELALLHIPDPSAVALLSDVAIGATTAVPVGGKLDTSFGEPVHVEGTLLARVEGPIENCAPGGAFGGTGPTIETGTLVCIASENVRLVLSEKKVQGPHPSIFTKVGLDPFGETTKIVVLKSGTGWQTTYEGKCAAMIRADCPGPMNYNVANFPWGNVRRPIYPLDERMDWAACGKASWTGGIATSEAARL